MEMYGKIDQKSNSSKVCNEFELLLVKNIMPRNKYKKGVNNSD